MGNLPAGTPEFRPLFVRFAKNALFRGIRLRGESWRKSIEQPALLDDLRRLAGAGLQADVNIGPAALLDAARLADAVPTLRIVLDHCANVPIDGKAPPAAWLKGIEEMAGRKNVWCKVSGLVEGTGRRNANAPAGLAFYRPTLDALWTSFGSDRLIFGSNWPVSAVRQVRDGGRDRKVLLRRERA